MTASKQKKIQTDATYRGIKICQGQRESLRTEYLEQNKKNTKDNSRCFVRKIRTVEETK